MAKYRKASEKTISRGKGISTDKLSLKDAKEYFNERAKETGAKRFRHNGQVYDLAGNKINESAPARSSGGGSSATPRPKARPATSSGGAQADQRTSGAPPARPAKSGAKRGEVNPAAVGAGLAAAGAAGAAGVAAVRSGRNAGKPTTTTAPAKLSISDRVRAAGAKAKAAAMGTPVKPKPAAKAAKLIGTPVEPKPAAKASTGGPARTPVAQAAKAAAVPKPKAGKKGPGGTRGGVRGGLGVDITTSPLEQIKDPLQLQ